MPPTTILDEAKALVYGDRQASYGHPGDDHARVAKAISGLLANKLRADLTALDVEIIMALVKLARLAHAYKRDSVIDLAGYAATMELAEQRRAESDAALQQSNDTWEQDRQAKLRCVAPVSYPTEEAK
jgi:stage V sporulation protein SpoVS